MPIKPAVPRSAPHTKSQEISKATSVASPASSATQRYEAQARREWDSAPPARGWSSSREEMRELEKEPLQTEQGLVSDVRAFTFAQWMALRVWV